MADADRPPLDHGFGDPEPDSGGSGEWLAQGSDEHSDEWPFDDTGDCTEPMTRAGTDPFDAPVRPAREQPGERAMRWNPRGSAWRTGRAGVTGVAVGAIGGLVTAAAVAASLALLVVAPDAPRESRTRARAAVFPISELAGPAPSSQPAAAGAYSPLADESADESADLAMCELDPLAPAPALPASEPAPARNDTATSRDRAASTPDEPAPDDALVDSRAENATGHHNRVIDPGKDAGDRLHEPGGETPTP